MNNFQNKKTIAGNSLVDMETFTVIIQLVGNIVTVKIPSALNYR